VGCCSEFGWDLVQPGAAQGHAADGWSVRHVCDRIGTNGYDVDPTSGDNNGGCRATELFKT
jgi:hypothetical protein